MTVFVSHARYTVTVRASAECCGKIGDSRWVVTPVDWLFGRPFSWWKTQPSGKLELNFQEAK